MSTYSEKDGSVRVKVESAYATDPTLVESDVVYVEELVVTAQRDVIQRKGASPYRAGAKPVVGPQTADWSAKVEMTPVVITAGTDLPLEDPWLQAMGFEAVYAAGPPKTRTYTLKARPTASVALEMYTHNAADGDGWGLQLLGCRADGSIEMTGNERWFLAPSGKAASFARSDEGARAATVYDFDTNPLVGGAGECQVIALLSDLAGTDEPYPMTTGRLVSATIALNNGVNLKRGVCGQSVGIDPVDAPTMELVLEVTDPSDFDPWQYQGNDATGSTQVPILVCIGSPDLSYVATTGVPGDIGTGVAVRFYGFITAVAEGADSGAKTWTLSLQGAWPEGAQPAGETAAEGVLTITYATKAA